MLIDTLRDVRGPLSDSLVQRLRHVRQVALDMDGTIYCGDALFPYTPSFLERLETLQLGASFLTNNCSRSTSDYVTKLDKLGLKIDSAQLHTSAHATLAYFSRELPHCKKIFLIGTDSLAQEIESRGYELVQDYEEPDAVIVGYDPDFSLPLLGKAAWWIRAGKPYVATHPDSVCPTNLDTVLIDCGSVIAMLKEATGRLPDMVPGKPDKMMLLGLCDAKNVEPEAVAMVGDRLYTDIEMAHRAGAVSVLVLSGEAQFEDVLIHPYAPDLVLNDVSELGELLASTRLF